MGMSIVEIALPSNLLTESSENVAFFYRSIGRQECTFSTVVKNGRFGRSIRTER